MKPDTLLAYHFTADTLRGGRPLPKIGAWLSHEGPVVPCQSGLHASLHPFDALTYAPGNNLHLVELRGDIQHHGTDKVVGRHRKIIRSINAEKLLREFARWNALQVIHLWKAPPVVRQYLETGDESLRAAARAAARAATRAAARAASWTAARAASWAAARAASWDAARAAARAAAGAAARDTTWAGAGDAARDAAIDAAAWHAAWHAARYAARENFQQMVNTAFENTP